MLNQHLQLLSVQFGVKELGIMTLKRKMKLLHLMRLV